jgi:hypothetical protein
MILLYKEIIKILICPYTILKDKWAKRKGHFTPQKAFNIGFLKSKTINSLLQSTINKETCV